MLKTPQKLSIIVLHEKVKNLTIWYAIGNVVLFGCNQLRNHQIERGAPELSWCLEEEEKQSGSVSLVVLWSLELEKSPDEVHPAC
jgi:hypothetical protein